MFDGHSAGGQFSYHFTQWKPERVIAFVTIKGGYHSLSPAGDAVKVPGYMFIGENDRDYRLSNLTTIFETHRPLGALWCLAMEPNAGHGRVSREIIHSFFNQIIPLRIPETIPSDAIPELIEINEESGFLGNRDTFTVKSFSEYTQDKTQACWFPNEKIAREWQNFVQGQPVTGISFKEQNAPENFVLYQNYPNPFNPSTTIKYNLPESGLVTLKILNLAGQEIETLVHEHQTAGGYEMNWQQEGLASGTYFYRLQIDDPGNATTRKFVETRKLVLQK
jgi:hypothetical protein